MTVATKKKKQFYIITYSTNLPKQKVLLKEESRKLGSKVTNFGNVLPSRLLTGFNIWIGFFGNLSEQPQLIFETLNKQATRTAYVICASESFYWYVNLFVQKGSNDFFENSFLRLKKMFL